MPDRMYFMLGILVLTFLLQSNINAQKCNYEVNEVDGLLEVPIKRTVSEMICRINNQPLYMKAQCIGTNKYLKLRYYKDSDLSIQENREISFVLPNDEEVILYPRPMPVDSTEVNDMVNVSSMLVYKLSAEQYEILKNTPVTIFKYYRVSGFIEKEIKASRQATLMDLLRCVE